MSGCTAYAGTNLVFRADGVNPPPLVRLVEFAVSVRALPLAHPRRLRAQAQSAGPVGVKSKSSSGTSSKNPLCSSCGSGHRTGLGCLLVYQFLQPPTQTVPGKAAPRRARNFSVAVTVGAVAAPRARASAMRRMMQAISWSSPNGTGTLLTGLNGP